MKDETILLLTAMLAITASYICVLFKLGVDGIYFATLIFVLTSLAFKRSEALDLLGTIIKKR